MTMTRLGDVETWWDVHGAGDPLVLLHPGGADSRAYDLNLDGLAAAFRTYRFDRRGQGRTPDVGGPITFADMTDDTIAFIETVVGSRPPARAFDRGARRPAGRLQAARPGPRSGLLRGRLPLRGLAARCTRSAAAGRAPGSSAACTARSRRTVASTGPGSGPGWTTSTTGLRR